MKTFRQIAFFLPFIAAISLFAQENCMKECPRNQEKANIFGTNFCCETKSNGSDIDCHELWGTLQNGQCVHAYGELVLILLYQTPSAPTAHIQRANEEASELSKKLTPTQRRDTRITTYHCPGGHASLVGQYSSDDTYTVYMYRSDSWFLGDFNIPLELEQDLFDYLCEGFNPKTFLNTPGTANSPAFRKINTPQKRKVAKKYKSIQREQQNAIKEKEQQKQAFSKTEETPATPNSPTPRLQKALPDSNAWHALGDYFYPAMVPGNLSSMRRFETKNKAKEIKINFSSKDKKPFLEKLKTAHRYHPARQTDCADGSILYETLENGLYQAFLLQPNATAVFTSVYNLPALPEEPHASKLQKELCALDIDSKW